MTTAAHTPSLPATGFDRWQLPAHVAQAVPAAPGKRWGIDPRIRKRRCASVDEVLHLRALPANLHSVLPPRLRELQSPEVQREEVFHALGQPLATAPSQRIAH